MGKKNKDKSAAAKQRRFQGVVVSSGMTKTIVIQVESTKTHPKYGKQYKVSKKYKVHDEHNRYQVGDRVVFAACRPLSKDKRWRVIYEKK